MLLGSDCDTHIVHSPYDGSPGGGETGPAGIGDCENLGGDLHPPLTEKARRLPLRHTAMLSAHCFSVVHADPQSPC